MSIQDDMYDVENALESAASAEDVKAFNRIMTIFGQLEVENEKLNKENYILKAAIKIVGKS